MSSLRGRINTAPEGFVALFDGKTVEWLGTVARGISIRKSFIHCAMSDEDLKKNQDDWNIDRDKHWHGGHGSGRAFVSDGHGVVSGYREWITTILKCGSIG